MAGAIGPRVVIVVVGVVDLVVSHVLKERGVINDTGGDVVIGVCIG